MHRFKWTNESVALFAGDEDPVTAMEAKARALILAAIDDGWSGPPFDPLALADLLKIPTEARSDIADARTVPVSRSKLKLEYNPLRPRGRLRFSIAHEIAHTLFPDCAESVRNRGGTHDGVADDWQLEVLCNIGAAELLMPLGSFRDLEGKTLSIDNVLKLRKQFDVSVEACLLRCVKLSKEPVAAFCASSHGPSRYTLDYVIPVAGWRAPVGVGTVVPSDSVVTDVSAIGYTATGNETWAGSSVRVECVGLAPYPGKVTPRVVGLLKPKTDKQFVPSALRELTGDALATVGKKRKQIVAHIVPNALAPWGGGGFANQLRRRFPHVWADYKTVVESTGSSPKLGSTFIGRLTDDALVVHMVAQHGFGPSSSSRVRYAALAQCLRELRSLAEEHHATVHMPRIGTGHGGANWDIVRELILSELVDRGIETTVYRRPS